VVGVRLYVERDNARAQAAYAAFGMRPGGYLVMQDLFGD
jgi:RimJ/RimL family protein N-acetyltransferase